MPRPIRVTVLASKPSCKCKWAIHDPAVRAILSSPASEKPARSRQRLDPDRGSRLPCLRIWCADLAALKHADPCLASSPHCRRSRGMQSQNRDGAVETGRCPTGVSPRALDIWPHAKAQTRSRLAEGAPNGRFSNWLRASLNGERRALGPARLRWPKAAGQTTAPKPRRCWRSWLESGRQAIRIGLSGTPGRGQIYLHRILRAYADRKGLACGSAGGGPVQQAHRWVDLWADKTRMDQLVARTASLLSAPRPQPVAFGRRPLARRTRDRGGAVRGGRV